MPGIVNSLNSVEANIHTYVAALDDFPALAGRMKQHPAWYAIKNENGEWLFGPSKFIGYQNASAENYLSSYSRKDGTETEPVLRQWFVAVDENSALGRDLRAAFTAFAQRYGKEPNARWRVSVSAAHLQSSPRPSMSDLSERIALNPDICGGRAHIRGTRVRVTDIMAALAHGETIEEILEDFPYLSEPDIRAALQYAASTVDHLVLTAA